MDHQTPFTMDWWMHELYRCIKSFIHNPTQEMQDRLISLITEYRNLHEARTQSARDEHEQLMNYR